MQQFRPWLQQTEYYYIGLSIKETVLRLAEYRFLLDDLRKKGHALPELKVNRRAEAFVGRIAAHCQNELHAFLQALWECGGILGLLWR